MNRGRRCRAMRQWLALAGVAWLLMNPEVASADTPVLGGEINLSTNDGASRLTSRFAVAGSTIYVVWQDIDPPNGGKGEILFKRSTDGGRNWGTTYVLSSTPSAPSTSPQVAVTGNRVHVAWTEYQNDGLEIYYKRITDDGSDRPLVFEPALGSPGVNLSNSGLASRDPRLASSGDTVYLIWQDEFDARQVHLGPPPGYLDEEVLFKASYDQGSSFLATPTDPPVNLRDLRDLGPEPHVFGSAGGWDRDRDCGPAGLRQPG